MTDFEQLPEGWIEDHDKAEDIAYSSKEERYLLVGSRLVADVIDPYIGAEEVRTLVEDAVIARDLLEIYSRYPEVFKDALVNGKPERMMEAIPGILKKGGLPLIESNHSIYRRDIGKLEEKANTLESIAEVLHDTPPSVDFLKDNGIRFEYTNRTTHRSEEDNPARVINQLLVSASHYDKEAIRTEEDAEHFLKMLDETENGASRLTMIIDRLKLSSMDIRDPKTKTEFDTHVKTVFDDDSSTYRTFRHLWEVGRSISAHEIRLKATEKRRVYNEVMSGRAASYVSETPAK